MASTTKIVCATSTFSFISINSSIISSSTWRRPAVSKITTWLPFFAACSTAAFAIFTGLFLSPMENTSTSCFSPLIFNCSIAAGRYTSQATSSGFLPFCFNLPAILAVVVVLPAPWRPTIIITVICCPGRSAISVVSEPMSLTISSFTILITICPGFSPFITSEPIARSCTALVNCFTTLKLTSASSRAIFTSFSAAFTSSSVSLPLLRRFLNTFWSFCERLSNAILQLLQYFSRNSLYFINYCILASCPEAFR